MLNFTHRNGTIYGQFNGRFAFHGSEDATELPIATVAELASGEFSRDLHATLRHEYLHYRVFQHSLAGTELLGDRFWTRREFVRGDRVRPIEYYTRRTLYFWYAFDTHETIVKALEQPYIDGLKAHSGLLAESLNEDQIQQLREADLSYRRACSVIGLGRSAIVSQIDRRLGQFQRSEFGLQYYTRPAGATEIKLRETTLRARAGSVVNGAFNDGADESAKVRLAKWVRRRFNTERGHIQDNNVRWLAEWLRMKVVAEQRVFDWLARQPEHRSAMDAPNTVLRDAYMETLSFAWRHTLRLPRAAAIEVLASRLADIARKGLSGDMLDKDVDDLAAQDKHVLYFFYCHGN